MCAARLMKNQLWTRRVVVAPLNEDYLYLVPHVAVWRCARAGGCKTFAAVLLAVSLLFVGQEEVVQAVARD